MALGNLPHWSFWEVMLIPTSWGKRKITLVSDFPTVKFSLKTAAFTVSLIEEETNTIFKKLVCVTPRLCVTIRDMPW